MNEVVDILEILKGCEIPSYTKRNYFRLNTRICGDKVEISYATSSGRFEPKPILINRYIRLDNEALRAFGLFQAEGCKSIKNTSFQFSNSNPTFVKMIFDYFSGVWGIGRRGWYCKIILWKPDFDSLRKLEIENYWSRKIRMRRDAISVAHGTERRRGPNAATYGVASLRFNSTILRFLANRMLTEVVMPKVERDRSCRCPYLQGLFAGDGSVALDPSGALAYFSIAFNPHSEELNHYLKLVRKMGIGVNVGALRWRRSIQITGWWNFLRILEATSNEPFLASPFKNKKFYSGLIAGQYMKPLRRMTIFEETPVTSLSYAKRYNVCDRDAIDCLNRIVSLGFANKNTKVKPYRYSLTKRGKRLIETIKELETALSDGKGIETAYRDRARTSGVVDAQHRPKTSITVRHSYWTVSGAPGSKRENLEE
jgi:predicted transcriptional regulator